MKKYVMGVDGGGTKTHCALFDMEGNKIDRISWGPTNHEFLKGGFSELKEELNKMLQFILNKNHINIDDIGKCVFGMAGVDTKFQHEKISIILKELGIQDFILCNDGFLGIKVGCTNGYGICAINGTGFSVVGINFRNQMLQVGGQGGLTGDKGGGIYLGTTAIGSVYNFLFKSVEYTLMKDILFDELGIDSKYDFNEVLTTQLSTGTVKIEKFCKVVFMAANMGDKVALQILNEMGIEYARAINSIICELDFNLAQKLEIVLAGSVFVKCENPTAIDRLQQDVLSKNQNCCISFKVLKQPPAAGAVIWALEGSGDRYYMYDKVMAQL